MCEEESSSSKAPQEEADGDIVVVDLSSAIMHSNNNSSKGELYATSVELVEETTTKISSRGSGVDEEEVYEAVVIPSRWVQYKRVIIGAGIVFIITAVAIALGVVFGITGNGNNPSIRAAAADTPPTSSTKQQPSYDCEVRDDGPLFTDQECLYFCPVAFDGEFGIVAMHNYKRVQFLSTHHQDDQQAQQLEVVSNNYVDFDYGRAVAMSGNVAVLGVNDGGVYVFERDDDDDKTTKTDTWNEASFLLPDDCPDTSKDDLLACVSKFGFSVDIDGDVIVVGSSALLDVEGAVYVYRRSADKKTWVKEAKFENMEGLSRFGRVVSVKGDRIAVASQGAVVVYVYDPSSKSWMQSSGEPMVNKECGTNEMGFGYSLSLVGSNGLLIGCPLDNDSVGTVRYYTRHPSTGDYIEQQKVAAFDQSIKNFGAGDTQLKVDGDNVIISTEETRNGSVFLFTLVDDKWVETARIRAPPGIKYFGGNTALSGGRVTVSSETNVHMFLILC